MEHFSITFKPDDKRICIRAGSTLLDATNQAGIVLNTFCGGKGTCRKCLVVVDPKQEQVLACQHTVESDLTVTVLPDSRFFEQKILEHGIDTQVDIDAAVCKEHRQGIAAKTAYGLAVDIGTTTVVAKLINMTDGQVEATQATLNPQTKFGDDVVSRIAYAQTAERLTELHKTVVGCINELVARLCERTSIEAEQICEMCVVGNTTMSHIFLNLPVVQLGRAPYSAYSLDAHDVPAAHLGLQMSPAGNIHTVENIAGFVGSDTTAVALAVDIASAEGMTLVVDIGTNGELVLGTQDRLYAASCAAGPALEGARIAHGSRAADGAIEAVLANDDIDLGVIGNSPARSICGSGLVDAVAMLLDSGIIDETGRFRSPNDVSGELSPAMLARIIEQEGQLAFCLAYDGDTARPKVTLTQKDVREVQLAKGAIRTGIRLLQNRLGLKDSDIEHILLAGAFGTYIRRESALRIGLLPDVPPERIRFVGNAASSGARMILLSRKCRAKAKELARKIEYVEIAHEPDFQMVYADSMVF
ncbi:MAG: DUF4445 domain-containing protein [Phycisphaerales bacterium]|nr:MAG: DUF4445 domain-containing protein [Phycisphaerales bacterium]